MTSSAAAGDAGEAESRGHDALVHHAAPRRSVWSSAWLMIGAPNGRAYSSARRKSAGVHHALAVVGERDAAGLGQLGQLGQLLAAEPPGDRADRVHAHDALDGAPWRGCSR